MENLEYFLYITARVRHYKKKVNKKDLIET